MSRLTFSSDRVCGPSAHKQAQRNSIHRTSHQTQTVIVRLVQKFNQLQTNRPRRRPSPHSLEHTSQTLSPLSSSSNMHTLNCMLLNEINQDDDFSMSSPRIRIAIPSNSLAFWARWTLPSTHTPVISLSSRYNALQKHREMAMLNRTTNALRTRPHRPRDRFRSIFHFECTL